MLSSEQLAELVPGIASMGVDEARRAIKSLAPQIVPEVMASWNEHHGRELLKDAHKQGRARRLKTIQESRAQAKAKAAARASKGKG